jgi:uncharacterized membrane protein
LGIDAPSRWMSKSWDDFRAAPILSLAWGAVFSVLGLALSFGLAALDLGSLIPATMAGFFLIAPILAVGLMDIARRRADGQTVSFGLSARAWLRNPAGLSACGLALMLAMAAWFQVAMLLFSLFFHSNPPQLDNFVASLLGSDQAFYFLAAGTILGSLIAATVFAAMAMTIPALLDREAPVAECIIDSVEYVWANRTVMLSWAATIVVLVGFGFVTGFIGLTFTLPLVAYGSWHAYEDFKRSCE